MILIILINIFAYTLNLKPGWQLKGALTDILVSELNNTNIKAIWCYDYDSKKWQLYSPIDSIDFKKYNIEKLIKINKEQGFWIYSDKNIEIETYNKIYDDNYSKFLIDKPKKFELNDIAGKTFKIIDKNSVLNLTFDNDGNSNIILWNKKYNVKYENGSINFYNENAKLIFSFQKIKQDNNGIIALKTFYNIYANNLYVYHYLDAWLFTNPSIINVASLLPITFYGSKGEILKLDSNYTGTLLTSFGNKFNCKIRDNDIIINNIYSYENTYGYNWENDFKLIKKIDRYYVLLSTINESYWCLDNNLKGKTFDDLMGSEICINDNIIYRNGYPLDDYGRMFYKLNNDGTITNNAKVIYTYKRIDSNTLKIFYDNLNVGILKIDTLTGKIIRINSYSYVKIVSKTPIDTITIKSDEIVTSTTVEPPHTTHTK